MTTGEHGADGSREDELLSRLYQQITKLQAARFGPGYDIEAGWTYRAWLGERTAERQDQLEVIQLSMPMTWQASSRVPVPPLRRHTPADLLWFQRAPFT